MKNRLCLIVCENYKSEFSHIIKINNMADIVLETFPPVCQLGEENINTIKRAIARNKHHCSQFNLLGGCNCIDIDCSPEDLENLNINKFDPCSSMLLSKDVINSYVNDGAFLITPGWLVNWKKYFDRWNLQKGKYQELLKGLAKYFILIDTGIHKELSKHADELSSYVEIDSKVLPVGLDHLTLLVKNIMLEWRLNTKQHNDEYDYLKIEENYTPIIEFLPNAVFIHAENRVVYANPSGLKLFGMTEPKQLIGKSITDFVHPDFHNIMKERINSVQSENSSVPLLEEKFLKLDGTPIDVEVASAPFLYNNKPASLVAVRDITKRKAMEEKLRESEEQYKKLIEFLPDAVLVHDSNKVLFCNKAAAKLFGERSVKRLWGKPIKELMAPGRAKIAARRHHRILSNEEFFSYANGKIINKNKTMTDVEITSTFIIYKGIPAIMDVFRDAEPKKRMEELKKSVEESTKLLNEAMEYDKLRTEFFSNISHEFRTPLNVILGTLQLINLYNKNDTLMDDPSRLPRYTNTMRQNCFRLLRLVNNLIDITKIGSGFFEINLQNHDIVQIVEDITLSVAEYIQSKGLLFEFDTNVEEKVLACDPDKIERIILNLLSNAVKFSRTGGKIGVYIHDNGEEVTITVRDTGIGIPQEKLDLIFERFTQIDKSLTREHEGSGIGLSIVKSLVEMHNGSIVAKSQYGHGSEFIITLPAAALNDEVASTQDIVSHTMDGHVESINIEFSDIYS